MPFNRLYPKEHIHVLLNNIKFNDESHNLQPIW